MPIALLDPIEALPPIADPRFPRLLASAFELLVPNGDDPYLRDGVQRALAGLILLLVSKAGLSGKKPSLAMLSDWIDGGRTFLPDPLWLDNLAGEAKTLDPIPSCAGTTQCRTRADRAFLEIRRLSLIPENERAAILEEIKRRLGVTPHVDAGDPPSAGKPRT